MIKLANSVVTLKKLSVASAGAVLIVWGTGSTAAAFSPDPLFSDVGSYTTTISGNNDSADIYFPKQTNLKTGNGSFPIALLFQTINIDKSNYSDFASILARYGFVVVVPNHPVSLPQYNFSGLLPETSQIDPVLAQMVAENSDPASPVSGIVDTNKLALLGHSHGGAVGLTAINGTCIPVYCNESYSRPKELVAGAFYDTYLQDFTQQFIPINNSGIPIALLQGSRDSIVLPADAQKSYEQIQNPDKAFITISGANLYGITNTSNPFPPIADPSTPTIDQAVSVETIARWSGLFLRASVLDDKDAFDYVYSTGNAQDANVVVTSQVKPVPEPSFTFGLVLLSALGCVLRRQKTGKLAAPLVRHS